MMARPKFQSPSSPATDGSATPGVTASIGYREIGGVYVAEHVARLTQAEIEAEAAEQLADQVAWGVVLIFFGILICTARVLLA